MVTGRPRAEMLRRFFLAFAVVAAVPLAAHGQEEPVDSLRAELMVMDSILFDALFVRCDAERANALFTEDVEFFDDRGGVTRGEEVRANSRRRAADCPAGNGVQRILLKDSVEVHGIEGYGAVQIGVHHFVERGASMSTIGRFTHIWQRDGDDWRLARILSLHETVDADRAAALRR